MCGLKELLEQHHVSQRAAALAVGISPAAMNKLVNLGQPPKRNGPALKTALAAYLIDKGILKTSVETALTGLDTPPQAAVEDKENTMIMRKQSLTMHTRQAFGLVKNPFADPQTPEDVYLSPESRYVREVLYDAAANGGFLAVVGESGSGKSTLRKELIGRLRVEDPSVIVIEPYTLGMASTEKDGKPLRAPHIAEAIISTVTPGTLIPSSPEMRFRKLHQVLKDSARAGFKHCVIIEEAHDLHRHTLKGLKRFWELEDGLKRLLSIILIGQTELEDKLLNKDAYVREVVQRCDLVRLPAVQDLKDFLTFRFSRARADMAAAFSPEALEELQTRLVTARDNNGRGVYMGFPLMISNFAIAAMNYAAAVGEKQVTADVVRQVQP